MRKIKIKIYLTIFINYLYILCHGKAKNKKGLWTLFFLNKKEKGNKDINIERTEEALGLNPEIIAVGCPFCMTMMTDGVKNFNKEETVKVMDIAELIAKAAEL